MYVYVLSVPAFGFVSTNVSATGFRLIVATMSHISVIIVSVVMGCSDNLSAVLKCAKTIALEDTPIPQPLPGQVQIRMHSVGICGSDVHYWQHMRIGDTYVVREPMILGRMDEFLII